MNCHGNNDNNGKGHDGHKGPMSHMIMMMKGQKGGEDNHNPCTQNKPQEQELVKKLEEKS